MKKEKKKSNDLAEVSHRSNKTEDSEDSRAEVVLLLRGPQTPGPGRKQTLGPWARRPCGTPPPPPLSAALHLALVHQHANAVHARGLKPYSKKTLFLDAEI